MKNLILFGLLFSSTVWSQELDVQFLQTQRPASEPYNIPITINEHGQIKFGKDGTQLISVNATVQTTYRRSLINYSRPLTQNLFSLDPVEKNVGQLEIRRTQLEYGMGLAALVKNTFTLGIIPYRGSIQTSIRSKVFQNEKLPGFRQPRKFEEVEKWRIGDTGTFQTYGGVQAYAGMSTGLINLATATIGIQNQFIVEIKRISTSFATLTITEEDLKRGQLLIGPFFAYGTWGYFDGKRLGLEFMLNLDDRYHHELFEEALKGNLTLLQRVLPITEQKLTWKGQDRSFYYGVPMVAGQTRIAGSYDLIEDEVDGELEFSGRENGGLLRKLRNTYQYIFHTEKALALIWTSEINKVSHKEFEKYFYSKGRIIGVRGFDRHVPEDTAFGSVISQLGISFSKNEIEKLNAGDIAPLRIVLKARCQEERLSCRLERRLGPIMNQVKVSLDKPWEERRFVLSKMMMKEPALIYAMVQHLGLKKEVYFKFLSEKFQSIEGTEKLQSGNSLRSGMN